MAGADRRYVEELAQTTEKLFEKGVSDPSADEIAEEHFPERALGGEIVEGIRKRLAKIRDVLENELGHPVYLLSNTYYLRYRHEPPTTEAEARRCLPLGQGVRPVGIRLQTEGDSDLIWQAMVKQNLDSGAGKVKKSVDRTLEAWQENRLEKPRAAAILEGAARRALPSKPELAQEVRGALPAKGTRRRGKRRRR